MTLTSKTKTLLIALVIFVGLAAAFGYWRFGRSVEVAVAIARQGAVPLRVLGPGTLQARTAVSLASRVNAKVVEVLVDVGHSVRKGQLLVTLDDRESSARLAAVQGQQSAVARNIESARATVAKAQAELELTQSKQRRDAELLDAVAAAIIVERWFASPQDATVIP